MSARQAAEDAGRSGTQAAKASNITGMSISEAKQILNVKDLENIGTIKKVKLTPLNKTLWHTLLHMHEKELRLWICSVSPMQCKHSQI